MTLRLALLLLGLAAWPATARADRLLDAAPGGVNLAADGGYAAWAQPNEDTGWSLVVRTPGGTVARPAIGGFPGPPEVSIGLAARRGRATAVYTRVRGGQADIYALDLATGRERRVAVSRADADEAVPSLADGQLVFVRRTGPRRGVFAWNGRGAARRLATTVALQTAASGSRVAYATADRVVVRKLSGGGGISTLRAASRPRSLLLSRYRASWLERDGVVARSERVAVAAGTARVRRSSRPLPAGTQSIAAQERDVSLRLGPDGLWFLTPALRYSG